MNLGQIALRRLRVVTIPNDEEPVGPAAGLMALADLTRLGYRVTNIDNWDDRVVHRWSDIVSTLVAMRGGDVKYAPLFPGFPNSVPAHKHVAIGDAIAVVRPWVPRSFLSLLAELLGIDLSKTVRVSSVPQDAKQKSRAVKKQEELPGDSHTEWIDLTVGSQADVLDQLRTWMERLLYASTPIKDAEVADIMVLLTHFGIDSIDPDRIVFLETKSLIYKTMWEINAFDELELAGPSPTDLLRLFARITGTDSTLMKTVRFPRFSKRQRRLVLSCIDQARSPVDELYAYRDLWLRIGEYLHPGQYRGRYPLAAHAFDLLRSERRNRNSLGAKCEALLRVADSADIEALVELLDDHPTVFARRLRHLLTKSSAPDAVVEKFAAVADQVPTKVLFTLRTHIATVNREPMRAIVNRGGGVRVVSSPPPLSKNVETLALDTIEAALHARLGSASSWSGEKVWIDERLANYVAPFQQRKVSDGLLNVGRGTRLPLDNQLHLRLFVYWQQPPGKRSDLDLSAITFDRDMSYSGQVSWTRLKNEGMTHSGDITSAPVGASEFINIQLDRLPNNVRYIAPLVYRYAGPPFNALVRAHAGWMARSHEGWEGESPKAFDISTVQNVFDLAGRNAYALPFVADLRSREVIYTDLYIGNRQASNQVESSSSTVEEICRAVRSFTTNRVTVKDLALANAQARQATLVKNRDRATLTIGLDEDCTLRGDNVAAVNAELLV